MVTIHNAGPGYHHNFDSLQTASNLTALPVSLLEKGLVGQSVEPFLLASDCAILTTVSPQYAEEILSSKTETAGLGEALSKKGSKIRGITNGIDFDNYDPRDTSKSHLPFAFFPERKELEGKYKCRSFLLENYGREDSVLMPGVQKFGCLELSQGEDQPVFIVYHGRLVRQKGISVLIEVSRHLLQNNFPVRIVCVGQGEGELEDSLATLSREFRGRFLYFKGYDRSLARLCTASADFSLFPSFFEPCGLEDFISQIYGTIPVANATGGLCKILDEETGFLFSPCTPQKLIEILEPLIRIKTAAPDIFLPMIAFAAQHTRTVYNWDRVASSYEKIYEEAMTLSC